MACFAAKRQVSSFQVQPFSPATEAGEMVVLSRINTNTTVPVSFVLFRPLEDWEVTITISSISSYPRPRGSRSLSPIGYRIDGQFEQQNDKYPCSSRSPSLLHWGRIDGLVQQHTCKSLRYSHALSLSPIAGRIDSHFEQYTDTSSRSSHTRSL